MTTSRRLWRSVAAVLLGFVAVFVLSLGTDQILHMLQVYPLGASRCTNRA